MLKKDHLIVEKEDAYIAMPTIEDDVVFAISVKENDPCEPFLMYDGKEHALLMRDKQRIVILDYLNSEIQEMLQTANKAFITEINYKEKSLIHDYEVPVEHVKKYPIKLDPFFE